jgi:hypothetical protein
MPPTLHQRKQCAADDDDLEHELRYDTDLLLRIVCVHWESGAPFGLLDGRWATTR